ncbi:undecaprenyl-diphosphatase UppP [Candidatus Saccharibacteria bacterium]|nr:undecaprenyl-diphosphatase UppP [Candidatus Saccharibacteria bacterium]
MNWLEALILGIIQGLTEFIPVSSSGHLIIAETVFGIGNGSLAFDVALHGGTLLALMIYFWRDILDLIKALFIKSKKTKLAWLLVLATIPAVVAGLLLESYAEDAFRSSLLVSFNLATIGLFMLWAESYYKKLEHKTKLQNTSRNQALTMGLAQSAAVVPGVSRSGITITAGLFVGMDRVSATRFSFLLGIPIIFGAFLKAVVFGEGLSQIQSDKGVFVVGIVAAFLSGLFAIQFLLKYLAKHTLKVFAYYRLALATLVITIAIFA